MNISYNISYYNYKNYFNNNYNLGGIPQHSFISIQINHLAIIQ